MWLKKLFSLWLLPVLVTATPSMGEAVLCIGSDGHVAIETIGLGNGHAHEGGHRGEAGHHVDETHSGGCDDYLLSGSDRLVMDRSDRDGATYLRVQLVPPVPFANPRQGPLVLRDVVPATVLMRQSDALSHTVMRC